MQALVYCKCGCGETVPRNSHGVQKQLLSGHNSRILSNFTLRDQTGEKNSKWDEEAHHNGIHTWLRRNFPKTGVCSECGKEGKTDHAFLHHPNPYTRERSDYVELCRSCHMQMDKPWGCRWAAS